MPDVAVPKDQIVVAEDSAPNRKILSHLLEKLGFEVIACENGKIAWDKIKSQEHKNVVAIISDMMMPEMDGLTLLQEVRGFEPVKSLPFVLVTAVSDKEYIVKAKALNVNGYVLKPLTFQRVEAKLKELFPNKVFPKLAG